MTKVAHLMPLVDKDDDGIRPAGEPDQCFYCHAFIGQRHGRECGVVTKVIEMKVTVTLSAVVVFGGLWQLTVPHHWDPHMCDFHKNDSSWCASNFIDGYDRALVTWDDSSWKGTEWTRLEALVSDGGPGELTRCACPYLEFKFVRIVDDTPVRELRPAEPLDAAKPEAMS